MDELCCEIAANKNPEIQVKTIYFGGGTPSLLQPQQIEKILNDIYRNYHVSGEEITIEINPNSSDKLAFYKKIGINRVSIGVQSTDDVLLKKIGRLHTAEEGIRCLQNASELFDNVSADIILGIDKKQNVEKEFSSISSYVKHISAYMLTLEEGTPLCRSVSNKTVSVATENEVITQYTSFVTMAEKNGFLQYETSNFALSGYQSKHNSSYWDLTPYLGFGASAHSYFAGKRYYNEPDLSLYLAGVHSGNNKQSLEREVSIEEDEFEYVMLSLRTIKGVDCERFFTLFKKDFFDSYKERINKTEKYLLISEKGISISPQYFLLQNEVIRLFLDE